MSIIAKCDICGKEKNEENFLYTLEDDIKTEEIQHVCYSCREELVDINLKLLSFFREKRLGFFRKVIASIKERKGA